MSVLYESLLGLSSLNIDFASFNALVVTDLTAINATITNLNGNASITNVIANLIPVTNNIYTLGTPTRYFQYLYSTNVVTSSIQLTGLTPLRPVFSNASNGLITENMPNGSLIIGNAGSYTINTLTQGPTNNIVITNGPGSITIDLADAVYISYLESYIIRITGATFNGIVLTDGSGYLTTLNLAPNELIIGGLFGPTNGSLYGFDNLIVSGINLSVSLTPTFTSVTTTANIVVGTDISITGNVNINTLTANRLLFSDSSKNIISQNMSNGQLVIGNSGGYTIGTLTGSSNITITNGAGSITLDTSPDSTFDNVYANFMFETIGTHTQTFPSQSFYDFSTYAPSANNSLSCSFLANPLFATASGKVSTNCMGFYASLEFSANAGTIVNGIGMYVGTGIAGPGVTNGYGLYVREPAFGTNKWNTYWLGGKLEHSSGTILDNGSGNMTVFGSLQTPRTVLDDGAGQLTVSNGIIQVNSTITTTNAAKLSAFYDSSTYAPTGFASLLYSFRSEPTFIAPISGGVQQTSNVYLRPIYSSNVGNITTAATLFIQSGVTAGMSGTIDYGYSIYSQIPAAGTTDKWNAYFSQGKVGHSSGNLFDDGSGNSTVVGAITSTNGMKIVTSGSVTQATSILTAVTLNASKGEITLATSGTIVNGAHLIFVLNNSYITSTSILCCSGSYDPGSADIFSCTVYALNYNAGSCIIEITYLGTTSTNLAGAKIKFVVF